MLAVGGEKDDPVISMAISGSNLLEVPTIYKAYVRPKFQGISPEKPKNIFQA